MCWLQPSCHHWQLAHSCNMCSVREILAFLSTDISSDGLKLLSNLQLRLLFSSALFWGVSAPGWPNHRGVSVPPSTERQYASVVIDIDHRSSLLQATKKPSHHTYMIRFLHWTSSHVARHRCSVYNYSNPPYSIGILRHLRCKQHYVNTLSCLSVDSHCTPSRHPLVRSPC